MTVHRGVERYSYTCMPACQPRAEMGDNQNHYGQALAQITARAGAVARHDEQQRTADAITSRRSIG